MTQGIQLFRLNIEVGDLASARHFYETLFDAKVDSRPGNRFYLDAGGMTLQVVGVSSPHIAAKALYFATAGLDAVHARAVALNCLSDETVHGLKAGDISVKPWGERSFYVSDPWGNPLCFVEAGTEYR